MFLATKIRLVLNVMLLRFRLRLVFRSKTCIFKVGTARWWIGSCKVSPCYCPQCATDGGQAPSKNLCECRRQPHTTDNVFTIAKPKNRQNPRFICRRLPKKEATNTSVFKIPEDIGNRTFAALNIVEEKTASMSAHTRTP